jgi:hypothetical protein
VFPADGERAARGGQLLLDGNVAALLEYRADLLQIVDGLGVAHYSGKCAACFICKATRQQLYNLEARRAGLWEPRTEQEYEESLMSQMHRVIINRTQLELLRPFLKTNPKRRGCAIHRSRNAGPAWAKVRAMGIQHGDVVLHGASVKDPYSLDVAFDEAGFATVCFFRGRKDQPVRFRTPLVEIPGFNLPTRIRLDVMHIADLGTTARFSGTVLRRFLNAGLWGADGDQLGVRRMLADLREWYRGKPELRRVHRLGRGFSVKQLGPPLRPFLKVKAAESRTTFEWVAGLLEVHFHILRHGEALLAAARAMRNFYKGLHTDGGHATLVRSAKEFLGAWKRARGRCTPKHHFLIHLAELSARCGAPSRYHTYPDESFHRSVKRCAKAVRHEQFAGRVLGRLARARFSDGVTRGQRP